MNNFRFTSNLVLGLAVDRLNFPDKLSFKLMPSICCEVASRNICLPVSIVDGIGLVTHIELSYYFWRHVEQHRPPAENFLFACPTWRLQTTNWMIYWHRRATSWMSVKILRHAHFQPVVSLGHKHYLQFSNGMGNCPFLRLEATRLRWKVHVWVFQNEDKYVINQSSSWYRICLCTAWSCYYRVKRGNCEQAGTSYFASWFCRRWVNISFWMTFILRVWRVQCRFDSHLTLNKKLYFWTK